MFTITDFIMIAAAIIALYIIAKSFVLVQQQECLVVERLGKFYAVYYSGLRFLLPFIDRARPILWTKNGVLQQLTHVDLRESFIDIPEQKVITKDNVGIDVDAVIYAQIADIQRATYEIQSLPIALGQLTQTTLRSLIGEMDLDHTLSNRELINTRLKSALDTAADKWGIKVTRVEIKNVTPPPDVQNAMEKQMQAERERRAKVLSAEGEKQSAILSAEGHKKALIERSEGERQEKINIAMGDKQAFIENAEGQAQAIERVAQAQAKSISLVMTSFGKSETASNYLVAMEYLKHFGKMTQKPGDKVYIPYEASSVLSSPGGIKDILNQAKK